MKFAGPSEVEHGRGQIYFSREWKSLRGTWCHLKIAQRSVAGMESGAALVTLIYTYSSSAWLHHPSDSDGHLGAELIDPLNIIHISREKFEIASIQF